MKKYIGILSLSIIATIIVGSIIAMTHISQMKKNSERVRIISDKELSQKEEDKKPIKLELKDAKTLDQAVAASDRVNVIVAGIDGERTDTLILASYDLTYSILDIMSIPRDTYIEVPGYKRADQHKINAVYGMGKKDGGMNGVKAQVAQLLGIPIHYYVKVDYKGVEDVVGVLGGVEVNITQKMDYDDPTASPPLHIHFDKGTYNLKGKDAVRYLRWRKNNDGSGGGSDLSRNARQIDFAKKMIKKSISSFNIINVVNTAFRYVDTDISFENAAYYATTLRNFNIDNNLYIHTFPGDSKLSTLSYFIHDAEASEKLMYDIYMSGYTIEENKKKDKEDKETNTQNTN